MTFFTIHEKIMPFTESYSNVTKNNILVYMTSCYDYMYIAAPVGCSKNNNVDISHIYWNIHGFNN